LGHSFVSEAEAAFAAETPSTPPPPRATPETCGQAAFEGGRPGHELEAEAVVDHGEAAGGEREALA
jgi:hypothetical protein